MTTDSIQHQAELDQQITQDKEFDLLAIQARRQICAQCEGLLVVLWNGKDGIYQLKCGRDKSHFGTKSCYDTAAYRERNAKEMGMQRKWQCKPPKALMP